MLQFQVDNLKLAWIFLRKTASNFYPIILSSYFETVKFYFPKEDNENGENRNCSSSCGILCEAEVSCVRENMSYTAWLQFF